MSDHFRRDVLKGIGVGTATLVGGAGAASARPPSEGDTIVDVAAGVDRFSILVAAVQRAGLAGALSGNRQLTVFAPNNEAFGDLLDALGVDSLEDIPVETLQAVLLYHVTPGRRKAASVVNADEVPTLNGAEIEVEGTSLNPEGQFPADIVTPNLAEASNGIIHEIDGVLNPVDAADDEDDDEEEEEEDDEEEYEEDDD
ncbi:MAG: fasciclin domain-containing protein [Haloarculaceae archaeon]